MTPTPQTGIRRTDNADESAAAMCDAHELPALTLTVAEHIDVNAALLETRGYIVWRLGKTRKGSQDERWLLQVHAMTERALAIVATEPAPPSA